MDELRQIMAMLEQLGVRMERLEGIMGRLYLPYPPKATDDRARKDFDNLHKLKGSKRIGRDADAVPDFRGNVIYETSSLDTKGFTHHNCFVSLIVKSDNVPPDLGNNLLFTAVLEGSCGSAFVELDVAQLNSTGRTGTFQVPLLAADSLAQNIRFRLWAGDNAIYGELPVTQRALRCQVSGELTSGPEV